MVRTAMMFGAAVLAALPGLALAEPVLLISIDGLQPADVIDADKRGIAIPNLTRFVKEGSFASAVIGVLPTITYPSHATLLTGVSPAKHGIVSNTSFDPLQINQTGWYWYASDMKVATLWDAAAKAGLTTANVHWPVSVAAKSVRWNLPQIWRTGHADDIKLMKALATPGLIEHLETTLKEAYAQGIDETITGDENRGRFAVELIAEEKPQFITAYFTALDHEQHGEGPNSRKAHAILERIDAIVGRMVAAQRAAHPDSVIAIVSDHGFAPTDTEVNLFRAFVDAGFIAIGPDGKIKSWRASPWNGGGSTAIVLAEPDDAALVAEVSTMLEKMKADPQYRIAEIAKPDAVKSMGGNPGASFYVNFKLGAYGGSFKGKDAALIGPSGSKGTHGYFPANPAMRSTFMMMGKGVARGRNLGEIDMRAIAPTLAGILKVPLPDAELSAIKP